MRDYWLTKELLQVVGFGYLAGALIVVLISIWLAKGTQAKLAAAVIMTGLAAILPVQSARELSRQKVDAKIAQDSSKIAMAAFAEKCKSAGERINRSVEGVEGLALLNSKKGGDIDDQFAAIDPAGDTATGDGYIETFLVENINDIQGSGKGTRGSYGFVEIIDENNKTRQRVTGEVTPRPGVSGWNDFVLTKKLASGSPPKYGVLSTDISTRDDRGMWIAGNSIKVIDTQTNEVLAERIGYIVDQDQGNRSGGRQPWRYAAYTACPALPLLHDRYPQQWALTRNFVRKVLKPI